MQAAEALRAAISADDLPTVQALVNAQPALLQAAIGYGGLGPLTWAAECRHGPPSSVRLDLVAWLVQAGADLHEGGGAPLMRAALRDERVPMIERLVALGADVNAHYGGHYPILFAPCETLQAQALAALLRHGAQVEGPHGSALDQLLGGYQRGPGLAECVELLLAAGARTRFAVPGLLPLLRGDLASLAACLDADPGLLQRCHAELDLGATAARRLTLRGATLLHVAAEFSALPALRLLLARGADVNARASTVDGLGGQAPLFHAASQFDDAGLAACELLLQAGANPRISARLPGHYERLAEVFEGTARQYAERFPGPEFAGSSARTLALLRAVG